MPVVAILLLSVITVIQVIALFGAEIALQYAHMAMGCSVVVWALFLLVGWHLYFSKDREGPSRRSIWIFTTIGAVAFLGFFIQTFQPLAVLSNLILWSVSLGGIRIWWKVRDDKY